MIEDKAVEILVESIKKQADISIEEIARRVVRRFNEGPKPEKGKIINLSLELNLNADLLYEIEEYLASKQNGKKKFRKNFYKRRG